MYNVGTTPLSPPIPLSLRKAFANLARIAEGSDAAAVAANKLILDRLLGKVEERVEYTLEVAGTKLLREVEEWERGRQIAEERRQRAIEGTVEADGTE